MRELESLHRQMSVCARTILLTASLIMASCSAMDSIPLLGSGNDDCDPLTVEAEGEGRTITEAIMDARHAAVSRELGEFITRETVLTNDEIDDVSGYSSRGEVVDATLIRILEKGNSYRHVLAKVTLCQRNALVADISRQRDDASAGLQRQIQAMLQEAEASSQGRKLDREAFTNAVTAILRPLGNSLRIHKYSVLRAEAVLENDDAPVVNMRIKTRISLAPHVRKDLESLLSATALKRRSPGPFGFGYDSIVARPGFGEVDQRLEQRSNPFLATEDFTHAPLGSAEGPFKDVASTRVLRRHTELTNWQSDELERQTRLAIEQFVSDAPQLVGWSSTGKRVATLPFEHAESTPSRLRGDDPNDLLSWSTMTVLLENARGRVSRANAVVLTPDWFRHSRGVDASQWALALMTPLAVTTAHEHQRALTSARKGNTWVEVQFYVPRGLAGRIDRYTLEPSVKRRLPRSLSGAS